MKLKVRIQNESGRWTATVLENQGTCFDVDMRLTSRIIAVPICSLNGRPILYVHWFMPRWYRSQSVISSYESKEQILEVLEELANATPNKIELDIVQ